MSSESRPLYRPLACWFCLPSFLFVLAPALERSGEAGEALALLAVLASAWVAPVFTLFALAIALVGHFAYRQSAREHAMWVLLTLAVFSNLVVIFSGSARLLR